MKKDKEWLKSLINKEGIVMDMHLLGRLDEQYWKNENIKINKGRLFSLIDELEEPETISDEFLKSHSDWVTLCQTGEKVKAVICDVLRDVIFPKSEEKESEKAIEAVREYFKSVEKAKEVLEDLGYVVSEKSTKPTIPQFVADYIETYKGRGFPLGAWFEFVHDEDEFENKTEEWLYSVDTQEEMLKREYLLIDAIRYGYAVEKEPQWVVKDDTGYLSYLQFSIPDIYERETSIDKNGAYKFNSKSKANLIADLVTGTVEEVTE